MAANTVHVKLKGDDAQKETSANGATEKESNRNSTGMRPTPERASPLSG